MRVLLVNQHYPPDSGATGKLAAQLADALVRRGHVVTALTGRPTYREAGVAGAPAREVRDGVHVVRVPMLPRRNSPVSRLLHYASFAAALLFRGPFLGRPDVLLAFSSTPILGGPACAFLARLLGCPFVYVVQDVYPEIAVAMGVMKPGRLERFARWLDAITWRAAAKVVVIGPELAEAAAARGVDSARLCVIANWADPREIVPDVETALRREAGIGDDDFVVEYAGNFGRSQDLEAVLAAARIVEERTAAEAGTRGRPVRFLLVGGGSCSEEVLRGCADVSSVTVLPWQPEARLPAVLAAADLSLVPLRRGLSRWCVPSKVYSILASGRPVGAALDAGSEVGRLVERAGCGFRVDAGDAAALADEILRLSGDPVLTRQLGRSGRARAEGEGSLERAAEDYESLLETIVRSSEPD